MNEWIVGRTITKGNKRRYIKLHRWVILTRNLITSYILARTPSSFIAVRSWNSKWLISCGNIIDKVVDSKWNDKSPFWFCNFFFCFAFVEKFKSSNFNNILKFIWKFTFTTLESFSQNLLLLPCSNSRTVKSAINLKVKCN